MKHQLDEFEINLTERAITYLIQLGNTNPTEDHISFMITILIASGLHKLIHEKIDYKLRA